MKKGQSAWLLTWEWGGAHAEVEDRIAGILRPKLSRRVVGEIVEFLYARHQFTPTELAYWAKKPGEYPYKAVWENGHCHCGDDPFLEAFYVRHLTIEQDPKSELETIRWVLPPLYRTDYKVGRAIKVRDELPQSVTRKIAGILSEREIGRN